MNFNKQLLWIIPIFFLTQCKYLTGPHQYQELNPKFTLTYLKNGALTGTVPIDSNSYHKGESILIQDNIGTLTNSSKHFAGWNTTSDGSGSTFHKNNILIMGQSNINLYALWVDNAYRIIYQNNSASGRTEPVDSNYYAQGGVAYILGKGSLYKTGHYFNGWNTQTDGLGSNYLPGGSINILSSDIPLYANWQPLLKVTYYPNGATGGTAPVDSNSYEKEATVTVMDPGTLTKDSCLISKWTSEPNGTGTIYYINGTFKIQSDTALYAFWLCY